MTAIETVNQHYQVIKDKNLEGICQKYIQSQDTYVVLEGPRLTTIGFEKIKKGWTDFCASSLSLDNINWIEGPFTDECKEMAWVSGIISLGVIVNKHNTSTNFVNTFRASFVLLKQGNEWKIKHEHVSIAHNDPYGIGDWLKK